MFTVNDKMRNVTIGLLDTNNNLSRLSDIIVSNWSVLCHVHDVIIHREEWLQSETTVFIKSNEINVFVEYHALQKLNTLMYIVKIIKW